MNKAAERQEAKWLARYKNEWALTPPDGMSLREYALDNDHAMALLLERTGK